MKILCIGRNYVDHIHELGNELPENMVIFLKPESALHHTANPWRIPSFSSDIHYECEIVLKIAKNGKNIFIENAESYFEEISLGIDFTARNIQSKQKTKGLPWEIAKAFDGAAIVGNFISKNQVDLNETKFQLLINNEVVQNGNSKLMLYNFQTIISELSKYFSLEVGDLIYTGTPAGVGKINAQDELKGILENLEVFSLKID